MSTEMQKVARGVLDALWPILDATPGGPMPVEQSELAELLLALKPMVDSYVPGGLMAAAPFTETRERLRAMLR